MPQTEHTTTAAPQTEPQLPDLVEHLVQFDGPPEQFLLHLLAVQCHVGAADGGAIVRAGQKQPEILALFPPVQENETAPAWLAQAIEIVPRVLASPETTIAPVFSPEHLYGQEPEAHLVLIPLRSGTGVRGAAAFIVASRQASFVEQARQRLELTVSLLSLYEMRLTLQARRADLQRLRGALEMMAAVNEMERFKATAMAFCNELASAFKAERVSIGFLKGRYVRVEGMSHTEKVVRKMELVQAIESSMEECIDQDVEIIHPAPTEAAYVSRATKELATRHGPTAVCSLPLRRAGKPQAVVTVERSVEQPFVLEEVETLRLAGELCTARLLELREHDKWVGAKAVDAARHGLETLVGPRHTWIKATVVGVCAVVLFLLLYPAAWRVDAPFEIQTIDHQVIASPFQGRIQTVHAKRGASVAAGDELLTMDSSDWRASLAKAKAQRGESLKAAAIAEVQQKTAEKMLHEFRAEQAEADIVLYRSYIEKSVIRSPIDGVIVEGDLKGSEGATLEQGAVLLRVASVDTLRAELLVPEKRIADVLLAEQERFRQRVEAGIAEDDPNRKDGELASVAYPGAYLPFVIEWVSPVAEVIDQRNVFPVRVRFQLHQFKDFRFETGADVVGELKEGPVSDRLRKVFTEHAIKLSEEVHVAPVLDGQWLVSDLQKGSYLVENENGVLNVFLQRPSWLKPGLQGIAKVNVGTATYAWLWSRDVVAWVRMKLWW